jgi:hypothetical protein
MTAVLREAGLTAPVTLMGLSVAPLPLPDISAIGSFERLTESF